MSITASTPRWPDGRQAAVCLSIDDVHPATLQDPYEAGGGLGAGAMRFVERLLARHLRLHVTLFVTPDWRPAQLIRSRRLARLPALAKRLYHVDLQPKGRYRVDRSPAFVKYLNELQRVDIAMHGLHHVHRGPRLAVEFQDQCRQRCARMLLAGRKIFSRAALNHVNGFSPPGWNLPPALITALEDCGYSFVTSARDIRTKIAPNATNSMSGLRDVSIVYPHIIGSNGTLVHVPTNFQATSSLDRAREIVECGGVLSVKAHIFKHAGGFTMRDGLDEDYYAYLDKLFSDLGNRYGDSLWWPSMEDVAAHTIRREKLVA